MTVKIRSGINGTMTNTGSQHFSEGDKRFYDKQFIQFVQTTTQSGISFVNTTVHKLTVAGQVQAEAAHNGYQGAMFPWESAWLDDGEVTPEYCDVDILTGLPVKVWSGFIEQHITSDVAFGAWQYATIAGDEDFMDKYGYELMMDAAIFWVSRLEPAGSAAEVPLDGSDDGAYHINDVVGPDEFREHVNDNAFTNYMARWNMAKAMEYYHLLKAEKPAIFAALNEKLHLDEAYPKWEDGCAHIFLPQPTAENVLPQDDATSTAGTST